MHTPDDPSVLPPALVRWMSPRVGLSLWLLALHLGLLQGPDSDVGRTLLLVHLGLFLIWQPVVRGGYRLGMADVVVITLAVGAFIALASWGLLAVWVMVLAGVVGGGAFVAMSPRDRLPFQLAVVYLVCALFVMVLPHVVPARIAEAGDFRWLSLTVLPLLILAIPLGARRGAVSAGRGVDFLSALLVFTVLVVTTLGALVSMWLLDMAYLGAIVFALFAMAGALLLMAWAWHPRLGGPHLGAQFARRLLSVGISFEDWLHRVATLALASASAEAFLRAACDSLLEVPGVRGGQWRTADGASGTFGAKGHFDLELGQAELAFTVHLEREPSPAMAWHLGLMVRLLGAFCREKQHATELETLSYVRAVHETGARLTHDVKNLLQSLNTLCYTAAQPEVDETMLKVLVGRQLPAITARLSQTLEKLRHPAAAPVEPMAMATWWGALQERHAGSRLRFEDASMAGEIPGALFNAAADNLIQNALDKRAIDPGIDIHVAVGRDPAGGAWLAVTDSGAPAPQVLAECLFRQPVPSDNGLGMGLYQVARQAVEQGYRLDLADNVPGRVCFRLAQAAEG